MDKLLKHLLPEGAAGGVNVDSVRNLFFGDYLDANAEEPAKRQYDEVRGVGACDHLWLHCRQTVRPDRGMLGHWLS